MSIMAGATGAAELELKLKLPRAAIASLLRHPALAACKRGRARRRRLVSTYFDTGDLRLAAAGIGLRLRRDGRKWIQTVKGPQDARSGGAGVPPVSPRYRARPVLVGRMRRLLNQTAVRRIRELHRRLPPAT